MSPHDRNQHTAIRARSNTVVRAGAGAGKTTVLVERYVRLVREDRLPVDRILTLTFTRKAAAEMHERIYRMMAQVPDEFVAGQLRRFDAAAISTLDSFCAGVARTGCAAFGVSPEFVVDEVRLDRFCRDLALRFLLERRGDPAVQTLVRLNSFGRLWQDGFAALAKEHFHVARPFDAAQVIAGQSRFLTGELDRLAGELDRLLGAVMSLAPVVKCIAAAQEVIAGVDLSALTLPRQRALITGAGEETGATEERAGLLAAVERQLSALGAVGKQCGSSRKPEVEAYKEVVDTLHPTIAQTAELIRTWRSWQVISGATRLAGEFHSVVVEEKRRTGLLSYHDVLALAIAVLEGDKELRRYYKQRFRAIMIDEFQDNNDEQKRLLYLLAERENAEADGVPDPAGLEPDKLFFVGDEKQSIYRFRGADVSVFKRLSRELGGEQVTVSLRRNYRSEPGLIAVFNEIFPRVFCDSSEAFEARFEPLESRDPTPGLTPTVRLREVARGDGDPDLLTSNEAEAYHIAAFIREAVERGTLSVRAKSGSESATRPVRYEDVAILMRSSANQMLIERMLRRMGVPYVAQTARSLFMEAPVNDIYNALQLLLYPQDRVALAAYLRSPLVAMSDDGLVRVLLGAGELFGPVPGLSRRDADRYALAAQRHRELRERADTDRLTDLLHHVWYRFGYRYHLLTLPEHAAYLEYYDYCYELARQYEEQGLSAFLDRIRLSIGTSERLADLDIVREGEAGVQVMTIHKAKGLEFPVVIVANAGNPGRGRSVAGAPFHWSETHGLVFNVGGEDETSARERAVNYVYRAEQEEAQLQDLAELKRLLYVAATRAESHLVFSGVPSGRTSTLLSLVSGPFSAAASAVAGEAGVEISIDEWPAVSRDAVWGPRSSARARDVAGLAARYAQRPPVVRRAVRRVFSPTELNAEWLAARADRPSPAAAESGLALVIDRHADDESPAGLSTAAGSTGLAEKFGTFTHYCVEQLGGNRASAAELSDPSRLPGPVRPALDGDELEAFLREGIGLAERFLSSDTWAALRREAEPEFELPFLLRLDADPPARARGQMDLVFALADRTVVIDFKSDRVLHPGRYAVQMDLYRRAAAAIFGRPAETVLYHLRSGTPVPIAEPVPDGEIGEAVRRLRATSEPGSPRTSGRPRTPP